MSRYPYSLKNKVLDHYFKVVTKMEYEFNGKTYKPTPMTIHPSIANVSVCHTCGACCRTVFSLDYLPFELDNLDSRVRGRLQERDIEFNGNSYKFHTDEQGDNTKGWCRYITEDAKCAIHTCNPFSCDFEVIRCNAGKKHTLLTMGYPRPHSMVQYQYKEIQYFEWREDATGEPYKYTLEPYLPACKILNPNQAGADEAARKLIRLLQWAEYFELETHLPELISDLQNGKWNRKKIYGHKPSSGLSYFTSR